MLDPNTLKPGDIIKHVAVYNTSYVDLYEIVKISPYIVVHLIHTTRKHSMPLGTLYTCDLSIADMSPYYWLRHATKISF